MKPKLTHHEKMRRKMRQEIAAGRFPQASTWKCQKCAKPAHDWHHIAYTHWNDVIALCNDCHKAIHKGKGHKIRWAFLLLLLTFWFTACTPTSNNRKWKDSDLVCTWPKDPCYPHGIVTGHL